MLYSRTSLAAVAYRLDQHTTELDRDHEEGPIESASSQQQFGQLKWAIPIPSSFLSFVVHYNWRYGFILSSGTTILDASHVHFSLREPHLNNCSYVCS
jgi:hypothetical protein